MEDFSEWDVVIQYYATTSNQGMQVLWMPYSTADPPPSGKWTVRGLYWTVDTVSEVYEPNVLNPGEEMLVRLNVTPAIPASTVNVVTVGSATGVTMSAPFSR